MSLIQTINIVQNYEKHDILKNINLSIDRGDVFALIGPTGAGKTTLLRILDFLEKPYCGRIYFGGVDITKSKELHFQARRRMAYVHQKPVVFTTNVFNNVAYALKWRHSSGKVIKSKTEEVLELVGLADHSNRSAKTLSGGETQRVAIARALITEPEVLFLDEPTANMDPISTLKIEEVLAHIIQDRRTTVVMSTHDMSQGQRLANRIGVLMKGELLQIGSSEEIFCAPKCREVAEFIGIENILKGVVLGKEDKLVSIGIDGSLIQAISDYTVGDKVYVVIRPEDIIFSPSHDKSSARNVFQGEIIRINSVGAMVRIEVDCGFPLLGVITRRSAEELNMSIGGSVYASFKATALHVVKRWN
jgi:tungstate transport system ATP-binding protein